MTEYTGDPEREENSLDDWGEEIYAISPVMECPMCDSPHVEKKPLQHAGYWDCDCPECGTSWTEHIEDDEDEQ